MSAQITFGILALNAQPFLEANLRALYPFASQIIVVEGAVHTAKAMASPDGHSTDGTLEMLHRFQSKEDPDSKLQIVGAREAGYQNGYWPEKDEMSRAYASRAEGDWLWQVDADEFYFPEDIAAVISMLEQMPGITAVSFPYREFFGGFDYLLNGKWQLFDYPLVHRLFRWEPGYLYQGHRPATVVDNRGRDLRDLHWVANPRNGDQAIYMHHYAYALPKQARQKVDYYTTVDWTEAFRENQNWYDLAYVGLRHPLFLGERGFPIFQWLERFTGQHPPQIEILRKQVETGKLSYELRPTEDIERLLTSAWYRLATRLLRALLPAYWRLMSGLRR